MPAYYPAFIDVKGRCCVVIGGGAIGEEKVVKLLDCYADVVVVSPEVSGGVRALADEGKVVWRKRAYQDGDLSDAFIAIAATDDNAVNRAISEEATRRNVLLNVVDVTHLCTFIAPSVAVRGDVTVAASTGGASPALARKFRELLDGSPIDSSHPVMDYAELAPLLADARAEIRGKGITLFTDHWQACITDALLDAVLAGRYADARATLMSDLMAGVGCGCEGGVCRMWEEKKASAAADAAGTPA